MSDFIAVARIRNSLGHDWGAQRWVVPSRFPSARSPDTRLLFGATAKEGGFVPFSPGMDRMARAMCCEVRNQQVSPVSGSVYLTLLSALKLLDRVLRDGSREPVDLTVQDLDQAALLATATYGAKAADNVIGKLRWVADLMAKRRLTFAPVKGWRPVVAIDPKKGVRARPMLSQDELSALAHLSNRNDLSPRDQLYTCVVDLLMCGGFRIGEVLTLPIDTLVREPVMVDGKPSTGPDGEPLFRYGLRYYPEKGGSAVTMLKALPTVMVPVAIRAIERARALTAETRGVAEHQSAQVDSTILGEPWDRLPGDAVLTMPDLRKALGMSDVGTFVRSAGLPLVADTSNCYPKRLLVRKADLYAHLFRKSFHGNCRVDQSEPLALTELLFVAPFGTTANKGWGLRGTAVPVRADMVGGFLKTRGTVRSVFERMGYTVAGKPIAMTSHQPRFFLNTLAMQHGLSPLDLARWMGRMVISTNAVYDRRDGREKSERLREKLVEAGSLDQSALPRPRAGNGSEADDGASGAVHVTSVGVCLHDLGERPCASHAEFGRTLTRELGATETSRLASLTRRSLDQAELARGRQVWGADIWAAAHTSFLEDLKRTAGS